MVIQLSMEKCRLVDDFWRVFDCEIDDMEAAAKLYDLMKSDKDY